MLLSIWGGRGRGAKQSVVPQASRLLASVLSESSKIATRVNPQELSEFAELLYSNGGNIHLLEINQLFYRNWSAELLPRLVEAYPRMICWNQVMFTAEIGLLEQRVRQLWLNENHAAGSENLAFDIQSCSEAEDIELNSASEHAAVVMKRLLKFEKPHLAIFVLNVKCETDREEPIVQVHGFGD